MRDMREISSNSNNVSFVRVILPNRVSLLTYSPRNPEIQFREEISGDL